MALGLFFTRFRLSLLAEARSMASDDMPNSLEILQTERPHLSDEVLRLMCQRYPLLQQGKVFKLIERKIDSKDMGAGNNQQGQEDTSTKRKKKYKSVPMPLTPTDVNLVVSDLIECGFSDSDLAHMFSIYPFLVGSTKAKHNFNCLIDLGFTAEWLLKAGKSHPSLFKSDVSGKLRRFRTMGFDDDALLQLIRSSVGRIFSYDMERKFEEFRLLGFSDDDVKRICKIGGNVFGMDLKKRFRRLEEVGFRDVVRLIKRYPQVLALRTKTITQFVEAGLGLSFEDVVQMSEKCPSILGLNATKAVERLETLFPNNDNTRRQLGKLIRAFPQALTYDVEVRVHRLAALFVTEPSANISSFEDINNTRLLLGEMFSRYPPILGYNLESRISLLEDEGIPRSRALSALRTFPQLVSYDAKSRIVKLKDAGLRPPLCTSEKLGELIGSFPVLLGYDIDKKLDDLEASIGTNRTQSLQMIISYPRILSVNAEATAGPAAQYLRLHNPNVTIDYLVKHPRVLTRSVENCLRPRVERLTAIGISWSPTTLVSLSVKGFKDKYGLNP
jgi:mTERF